jgi:hypothetical protein
MRAGDRYAQRLRGEVTGWFGSGGDAYRDHAAAYLKVLDALCASAGFARCRRLNQCV